MHKQLNPVYRLNQFYLMRRKILDISCLHCKSRVHTIFKGSNIEEEEELNRVKSCSLYKKGQYIFTENAYPLGLYCINQGKVKLATMGNNGKEQILRLSKDGDILGYRSLLSEERYHCSAIAMEDCSICFVPKDLLFKMLHENSKISIELLKLLASNLRQAEEQIISMAQKNVRERVAEALLFFKATYGLDSESNALNINFNREEIADFVGTSTESAIRLLAEFNNDGIIKLEGKKIIIVDLKKLIKTADLFS